MTEKETLEKETEEEEVPNTPKMNSYNYTYCQFTVSPKEKKIVENYAEKENFRTISDFLRKIVFDYIRRKENPEMFLSVNEEDVNSLVLERIHKSIQDILKNQEFLLQREDVIEDLREMVTSLYKKAEAEALAEEREAIIELLGKHSSLSMRQIQDETGYLEDMVFKILSDMSTFKITQSGRFALR